MFCPAHIFLFKVPFGKSVRVTASSNQTEVTYIILRGVPKVAVNIGGVTLPKNARLKQFTVAGTYPPLTFIPLVDIPQGNGMLFQHTLSVSSGNLNFLEACYHAFTPYNQSWPGILLSTGTEDYYDSAYYFDGGQFEFPVSGFTHLDQSSGNVTWSAYRFHEQDPILFSDGFQFLWRIGDMSDRSGIKCLIKEGGTPNGSPTTSTIKAYTWVYVW